MTTSHSQDWPKTQDAPDAAPVRRLRTLSIVILTYNEAHRLRPCLESVAGWVDEIVVVDGDSTDGTAALAREFTPYVFLSDLLGPNNPGGFSAQRNFALTKASGDWVLFVDADERVTPELRDEILARLVCGPDEGHDVYQVRRLDHYFGVRYAQGDDWQRKVMRRGCGVWDGRQVHETLISDGTTGELAGYLLHYSKDTIVQHLDTMNRYTSLDALEENRVGVPPRSPWGGTIRTFFYWYFHARGYRGGTFGLLMSLMQSFYSYLVWAKRWELCKNEGTLPGETSAAPRTAAVGRLVCGVWDGFGYLKRQILSLRPRRQV